MTVLDVATGTGLVGRAAAAIVGRRRVVGVDPSAGMLGEARRYLAGSLVQGAAEELPFADDTFDLVSMGYALRHVADLEVALREYRRVLRRGGRVLLLEISRPRGRLGLRLGRWYLSGVVPRVTRMLTGSRDAEHLTRYYWETIDTCVPPEVIVRALVTSGFEAVAVKSWGGLLTEFNARKR